MVSAARIERGTQQGVCQWIEGVARTVLPVIEQTGVATAAQIDVDTLAQRIHAQALELELDATLTLFSFVGAWSRV
jgi:hypothetical protein